MCWRRCCPEVKTWSYIYGCRTDRAEAEVCLQRLKRPTRILLHQYCTTMFAQPYIRRSLRYCVCPLDVVVCKPPGVTGSWLRRKERHSAPASRVVRYLHLRRQSKTPNYYYRKEKMVQCGSAKVAACARPPRAGPRVVFPFISLFSRSSYVPYSTSDPCTHLACFSEDNVLANYCRKTPP